MHILSRFCPKSVRIGLPFPINCVIRLFGHLYFLWHRPDLRPCGFAREKLGYLSLKPLGSSSTQLINMTMIHRWPKFRKLKTREFRPSVKKVFCALQVVPGRALVRGASRVTLQNWPQINGVVSAKICHLFPNLRYKNWKRASNGSWSELRTAVALFSHSASGYRALKCSASTPTYSANNAELTRT